MANLCSYLETALRKRWLIRISRRFESTAICGYVSGIGPEFFLLALLSDRIWFDGFECFRIDDIWNVDRDPFANFAEAALRLREDKSPESTTIKLGNLKELLLSASSEFPLISIHREENQPKVCHVGQVISVEQDSVSLKEISPNAVWDAKPTIYRLSEITRVSFGGDYENALHLVGRSPRES